MKVLIVEDEAELADSICAYLAGESFVCETARDYRSAAEKIALYDYTCIILDINLPDRSGLEVLQELQRMGKADGVLIVSARNALDDKVAGLKAGADDYLTKPFYLPELAARVQAIIRRKTFNGSNTVTFDELQLNLLDKTALVNGTVIELTRKEYELLLYLVSNKNKVVSKNAIAEHLWGDDMDMADSYDFIYSHIKNIRRKLAQAGCPDYIRSVYGMGYKFTQP
jgi:DNA-binding response OmpR family regulator